jgi:ketosteroid isomerase-like protein
VATESNTETVRAYLSALANLAPAREIAPFFTADAEQHELPNRLNPNGQTSSLESLLDRVEKGRSLLSAQNYEILNIVASADAVAVEADWTGTLTNGTTMRAHFAIFFEFREGRIARQRNYDCFEPF